MYYIIVTHHDFVEFQKAVSEKIKSGYEPHGNFIIQAVTRSGKEYYFYYQPMKWKNEKGEANLDKDGFPTPF